MIKILRDNLNEITDNYFEGISKIIVPRLEFYKLLFECFMGTKNYCYLSSFKLETATKTSLINKVLVKAHQIKDKSEYLTLNNVFLKHEYINMGQILSFINYFLTDNNLKTFLLTEPKYLQIIENYIESNYLRPALYFTSIKDFIENIFDYKKFGDKKNKIYNAYNLSELLDVNVCVYCNRQYTFTIRNQEDDITRPTFDHFYDKSTHPILALSFYNLIPSCSICNSYLKPKDTFTYDTHLHPYDHEFGEYVKFSYKFYQIENEIYNKNNFEIYRINNYQFNGDMYIRAENSINDFKIIDIYQGHTDIVGEIFGKCDRNSKFYEEDLINRHRALGTTKKEFYQFYFGNYYEYKDLDKRVLSKLTRDIVDEFGIFDNY